MSTFADVFLWGTRIGSVALVDGNDVAQFEYDPDFLPSSIEVSPLVMPLSRRSYSFPQLRRESFHGLPGLLADSLPDRFGNAVIDAWLSEQGRAPSSLDAVERLCYTGSRGMGALEYVPATGPNPSSDDVVHLDRLVSLASRILSQRESLDLDADDHALAQLLSVGTSAGGARAKAVIAFNPVTREIRSGQVESRPGFEHWIVKFDGVSGNRDKEQEDAPHYTRIEYAYYLMATAAGIDMSECRLLEEGGNAHFLTRRFDRTAGGEKLHMQTLGGIAHFDFMEPGVHSYEQASVVMRRLGLGQEDVERLYLRMVFNIFARNQDDHVKNISFLMDKSGRWSLAPAYDVTFAYNPSGIWTGTHQMTVNGKRDGFELRDLEACAVHMSIKPRRAKSLIEQVRGSVARWSAYAERAGISEERMRAIERFFL